jgi:hypothetical protein
MAGQFVADEMRHVELNARMAMALGGAALVDFAFDEMSLAGSPTLTPQQRANELIVRTCCIGEGYSVPILAGTFRAARHPLVKEVLRRIVRDESPHARLGWLYLDWIADDLDEAEKSRLSHVALDALRSLRGYWSHIRSTSSDGVTCGSFRVADIESLGWMEAGAYRTLAHRTVRRIVASFRNRGFPLESSALEGLLHCA